jgi:hypothetical protein
MRARSRILAFTAGWAARLAVLAAIIGVAVAASSTSNTEGHAGHPQKKLFTGNWWRAQNGLEMDLTTSDFVYECDGGTDVPSCVSQWSEPMQDAIDDWNAQPMDVNFVQVGNQDLANDIFVVVVDELFGNPGVLGVAIHYDIDANPFCDPDACIYYYGDAYQADDAHDFAAGGAFSTAAVRRSTVLHELGHLINLRHESVSGYPNEAPHLECGTDFTGPIPVSIMAYDCINPPAVGGSGISAVQDWDTCGVNHKYFDAAIGFGGCHSDSDGVHDGIDNCMTISNPTQANFDGDAFGDACDPDIDGDGIENASDPEADGDRVMNIDEINCGSDPNDSSRRPERIDGIFAGVDDDGDTLIDEALPPGAANYDCDGDGYKGSVEAAIFSGGGNGDRDPCGNNGWPSDLVPGPFQPNTLNVQDLGSFVTPVRRFQTSSGDPDYSARWDLVPGSSIGEHINIQDLGALVTSTSGFPPMLLGARAFGKTCPWAP